MCGEKSEKPSSGNPTQGSPPHVRGKEQGIEGLAVFLGITPAYAGKRSPGGRPPAPSWDHPRIRGEKLAGLVRLSAGLGSPPHTRGKVVGDLLDDHPLRITPAYAGKSLPPVQSCMLHKDHPRIRGEKKLPGTGQHQILGSPPHARGKVPCILNNSGNIGITPAYAGKRNYRVLDSIRS